MGMREHAAPYRWKLKLRIDSETLPFMRRIRVRIKVRIRVRVIHTNTVYK